MKLGATHKQQARNEMPTTRRESEPRRKCASARQTSSTHQQNEEKNYEMDWYECEATERMRQRSALWREFSTCFVRPAVVMALLLLVLHAPRSALSSWPICYDHYVPERIGPDKKPGFFSCLYIACTCTSL